VVRKTLALIILSASLMAVSAGQAMAASAINLNSSEWLGSLKLDSKQLNSIKKAVESALKAPVDAEQQCGTVRSDCVVRAAREWKVEGDTFREIVIHIHTVGHASRAVASNKGKWPSVVLK